jgi:hypothetical protein
MNVKKPDYSIFDKFKFERKPVGVRYSLDKPEGIAPTDKSLALCELFKEAQNNPPFYIAQENVQCGEQVLGMKDFPPVMYSGQLGPMFAMFKNPGAHFTQRLGQVRHSRRAGPDDLRARPPHFHGRPRPGGSHPPGEQLY